MEKRLQTILAHAGVASRRRAAELIEKGKVKVNGRVVTERGFRVDPAKCKILIEEKPIPLEEEKRYFLLNKPQGFISTTKDTHERRKITDLFKGVNARLYPVGRLDKDTTGLLVVTNDGDLAHRLAHPSFEIEKEYEALVTPPVGEDEIQRLEKGIELDGKLTSSCKIEQVKLMPKRALCRVKLHEGRKRQIKRMFEAVGAKVISLKRTKYAGLTLGRLKEGEFRALTPSEVKRLKSLK